MSEHILQQVRGREACSAMARGVDIVNHRLILSKALLRRNCIGLRGLFIRSNVLGLKSFVILMDLGLFKEGFATWLYFGALISAAGKGFEED